MLRSQFNKQLVTSLFRSGQQHTTCCFSLPPSQRFQTAVGAAPPDSMSPSSTPPPPQQQLAPPGLSRTFYKRELKPPAIPFSSSQGKLIFAQALSHGTCNSFFPLIEQFRTQDEPAFCGLASVAMVLNTLSIDPRRTWKGPWRWFHEEMLDCCLPMNKVLEEGVTLEQAACLARCNGAKVDVLPYGTFTLEQLRSTVKEACSSGSHTHIIVSYSRREVNQTGDGHFSPIGGYSAEEDAVLILDTARFKYPPHWLPLESVYKAMASLDPVTMQPRGYMMLGMHPRMDSVLFTLDLRAVSWRRALHWMTHNNNNGDCSGGGDCEKDALPSSSLKNLEEVVHQATSNNNNNITAADTIQQAVKSAPLEALRPFVAVRTAGGTCSTGVCIQTKAIETLLNELRSMPLYPLVSQALSDITGTTGNGIGNGTGVVNVSTCGTHAHLKQQQQHNKDNDGNTITSGCSQHSIEALSSPIAAVDSEHIVAERMTMVLLLSKEAILRGIMDRNNNSDDDTLVEGVKKLLDVDMYKVVGIELEYLSGQMVELPTLEKALDEDKEQKAEGGDGGV